MEKIEKNRHPITARSAICVQKVCTILCKLHQLFAPFIPPSPDLPLPE